MFYFTLEKDIHFKGTAVPVLGTYRDCNTVQCKVNRPKIINKILIHLLFHSLWIRIHNTGLPVQKRCCGQLL